MKNKAKTLKKIFFIFSAFSLAWLLTCCNQENIKAKNNPDTSPDLSKKEIWAELVESKTSVIKPEGFDDVYWNSVNKKMDRHAIFNTIVDAIISGKKQAYNIITDSIMTIDEVKAIAGQNTSANSEIKKINENDISSIRMREKWVFDKEKFTIEKQVTRIDFLLKKLDENGDYIGDKPLFYINL